MSDLIERQAAIDTFEPWLKVEGYSEGEVNMLKAVLYELRFLPSVRPKTVCVAKITLSDEQVQEAFEKAKNEIVQALPSAQPEIIRCKDCLHWVRTCGDNQWGLGDCDVFDKHLVMCEGYCAWAERRTNGSD